jgi:hypothetical protein
VPKFSVFFLLLAFAISGCAEIERESQATRPAETNAPDTAGSRDPKTRQWFTPDTPETLPADKLEKMNKGGPGGFGGY